MVYLYLVLAVFGELIGTTCLKYAQGFTRPLPSAGAVGAYVICFYFLSKSLTGINLSVAYASWSGLGIVAAALLSLFLFNEQLNLIGIIAVVLIIAGVVILNIFGSVH
ncbi:QacE family quaternary ammonium compound efflux SMR transporter [Deltaproteobacteria bacterium Smac51]|nr:QacE family quaternary ammonium compound efflux SMR transporter [Deltaproteobacteria bacterium Smac51]